MDEPVVVPEWVCTLVGRLVLDNEALRRTIQPEPPFVDLPFDSADTGTD